MEPLAPNTVERMFELHRDITRPKKSGSVASIVHDLEIWEGELEEYYRVGGTKLDERTKLLTAHAMLPDDTSPMIRLMIKGCLTFDSFKTELRNTIKFLGQYDCLTKGRSAAHAVEEQPVSFDEEGFRRVPKGAKICELPMKVGGISQKERKAGQNANRFVSLASLDDDDQSASVSTTVPCAAPIRPRAMPSKPKQKITMKGDFDDILAEFSAHNSVSTTVPDGSTDSPAGHRSEPSPPPALTGTASRRPVRHAHFKIGGIGSRCADAACDRENSSRAEPPSDVSVASVGANLEASTSARMKPTPSYCSVSVPNDEPNRAQLLSGTDRDDLTGTLAVCTDRSNEYANNIEEWQEVEFEAMLDNGCSRYVAPAECAPGYRVQESFESRRGDDFTVGNGEAVPNQGNVDINLQLDDGSRAGRTVFSRLAVADLNHPLTSVHQICQNGHTCTFTKDHALVTSSDGEVVAKFQQRGGTYKARMKLKAPSPFGGQGR